MPRGRPYKSFRNYRKAARTKNLFSPAQNKAISKKIERRIVRDAEKKFIDLPMDNHYVTATGYNNSATAIVLSNPAAGTGQGLRIGNEITPVSLTIRYNGYWHNNAALTDGNTVRVVVFQWHLSDAAPPALGSVLQSTSQYEVVNSPYTWVPKHQNDYTILYDKRHKCSYDSQIFQGMVKISHKKLRKITFDSSGAVTGDNNIYIQMCSDDTGLVSGLPYASFYSRMQYIDE